MSIIPLSDLLGFFSFVRRRVGISLVDPMPEAEVNSGIVASSAVRYIPALGMEATLPKVKAYSPPERNAQTI